MNTIVIQTKSKSNFDLILTLVKKLGEKSNVISDKTLADAFFVAEIESGINSGFLKKSEKSSFIKSLKSIK